MPDLIKQELRILYLTYDCRESFYPYPCGTSYPDVFCALNKNTWVMIYKDLYQQKGNRGFHDYINSFIEKERINVVFYATGIDFEIHCDFFAELRKKVFVVFYFGDDIFSFDVHYKYLGQCANLVITNIAYARYKYEELGILAEFYPPAFDTSVYYPISGIEKDIDVSFIGYYKNRKGRRDFVDYAAANGINISLWGVGTPNGVVSRDKKNEIYNRSKINLDFTGIPLFNIYTLGHSVHQRIKHPKGRNIEVALAKSFLLSEYAPGLEAYCGPEMQIGVFHTKKELLDNIRYYLQYSKERQRMAENAYQWALKHNEVYSQSSQMLDLIRDSILDEGKNRWRWEEKIYIGKEYQVNYATYRIFWIIKFLKLKKWKFAWEELVIWFKFRKINLLQSAYYISKNISFFIKFKKSLEKLFNAR